ncbi:hypothetical protein [Radiobacillus deserti]|uniref:Uncharacterized protein n=1 Tax=Radiobacillus deserti TaxID=2594883 RepID=A0A516KJ76_9BACI|nr:hypothetical protein [Radiobacillus deserti]QDP41447.1 hypothetical protein FN924_15440 [Radiobacillus deserti]
MVLLILWIVFILIGTTTRSVFAFLEQGKVNFNLVPDPSYYEFFELYGFERTSKVELVGHFIMFGILAILLYRVKPNKYFCYFICIVIRGWNGAHSAFLW